MAITQEIDLNLIPSSAPVIVHLNQYDEGKGRIIAHLYNSSQPYVPGVNATVKVQGTKPDKHAFQYWCDIDGSTVTVDVNVQMTAVAGLVPTQLIVNETSGVTGSFAFQLDVQASTLPSNIDVSETDLPILTEEAQEAARRAVQAAASAKESAEEAAAWSANPPYIGENLHWFVYDTETEQFVDSGVVAEGQDGEPGNKWYKGTAISGESSTPTVFPSSGIALAYHNDFYLNATEGSIYHCETPGDASTATWVYDFRLSGGGGGVTNYNDLTNKPKVGGVELTGNKTIADLGGVQSFNGRSGSILPVAGDYKSNQIVLSSIMHIGGATQDDVQEALEALDSKDAGGSTITVTTAEVTLRGKNVTLSDGVNTWTKQFDNAGKAIFTSIMSTGTLSVTASDGTETASGTINAPYFGNYTCPIAFFEAVVTVYGGTGMLGGCPVAAKKDGVVVASGVLSNIFGQPSEYVFHLNQPGTYTFEVTNDWRTFSSDPATYSTSGTYNTTVNGFETDVVVYTSSTEFKGKDVTVTCAGVPTSTIRLDASLGSAVYKALMPGTYTFSLTYQGTVYTTSAVVTVTDTQISAPPLALWTATLAITTSSSSLYGKTITIKKGSTTVGTTAFSAQGSATYTVHETGTYTLTCEGHDASVAVSAETTYNVTINAELDLAAWITAGSTTDYPLNPSSYADFSALEADEAAVRQLMTVHASVDYLATATAGDSLMQSVINSDVCAKWINLRDYALDTLSANSDIADEMDTDDKYGYGEWGIIDSTTTPPTWGALGNVPIMTSNTAPYGEAFCSSYYQNQDAFNAYRAFSHNTLTDISSDYRSWIGNTTTGNYVGYKFINPICVKRLGLANYYGVAGTSYSFKLEGSNDGATWHSLLSDTFTGAPDSAQAAQVAEYYSIDNDDYYTQYKVTLLDNLSSARQGIRLQFYGHEEKLVNGVPTPDYSEKEFAQGSTRKTIYDHGVEVVELEDNTAGSRNNVSWSVLNESNELHIFVNKTVANQLLQMAYGTKNAIDFSNNQYNSLIVKIGSRLGGESAAYTALYTAKTIPQGSTGTARILDNKLINTLDVSSITGSQYVLVVGWSVMGTINNCDWTFKEIWLE